MQNARAPDQVFLQLGQQPSSTPSPAPSNGEENWVLTFGGDAAYWHHRCNFVQVYPGRAYDLVIRVINVGQAVDKVVVTPELRGGGLELP